jgi:formylglycine-generating enzyme required for sulfatase activity
MGTSGDVIEQHPYEQPQHVVELTSGFWIDKYEVTNVAFHDFVADGGYLERAYWSDAGWDWLSEQSIDGLPVSCTDEVSNHPRVCVTWYEAEAYANWRGGQLPSEAQWEFAARGPESLIYPWGDTFNESFANVVESTSLTPVGNYPDGVSWVGAHDMSGNAMEWVQDWFAFDYYWQNMRYDPPGPETGNRKIERGGYWGGNTFYARSADRSIYDPPFYQDHHIGFRVVSPEDLLE